MIQGSGRVVRITLAMLLLFAGLTCRSKKTPLAPQGPVDNAVAAIDGKVLVKLEKAPPGLALRLSEGRLQIAAAGRTRVAKTSPLPQGRANALLGRLAALKSEAGDRANFALRDRSQPPPRTGMTMPQPFPPPDGGSAPPTGAGASKELTVRRYSPEGSVPIAPHLSVTFSQPMVAVTSHDDSIAAGVPVKLSPQPAGKWRWVGTRTLLFDPEVRFPMATSYQVDIPSSVRSATGTPLSKAVSFSFTTPPPMVKASWPTGGPHRRDPVFFVSFDQKIDADAVLKTVRVESLGRRFSVRPATATEIEDDETVAGLVDAANKAEHTGRYIVFRTNELLPVDSQIIVVVGPGTPSAEGPLKTTSEQTYNFHTYGPLKIVRARCGWGRQCPPGSPWSIEFTNPLDEKLFDPGSIATEPSLPRQRSHVSSKWMTIEGASKPRTNYQVTIPALLKDTFGQTLGKDEVLSFQVGDAHPQLFGQSGLATVDPIATKPTFDVHSINIKSLDVEIYAVDPSHWDRFAVFMQKNPREPKSPPGRKVFDRSITVAGPPDEMSETSIDLSPALGKGGLGHAIVLVEPTTWPDRYKPQIHTWVQSTDIGLDAFVDSQDLLAWTTNLADGSPLADVELEIRPYSSRGRSDKSGLATLPLGGSRSKGARALLLARRGNDVAFLPENTYFWSDWAGWQKSSVDKRLAWFVFDDRQMYRPKEEVHIKGWIRVVDPGEGGDVEGLKGQINQVSYRIIGPRGNEIGKGTTPVNSLGGFDTAFKLPDTPNLGRAQLVINARTPKGIAGGSHRHWFEIQEFRRPEFEVSAQASQGPHLVGTGADVTASADYYAGGPLVNADVNWSVRSSPTDFTPPNRQDFTFGTWTPWWTHRYQPEGHDNWQQFEGVTDATGKHVLHMDFLSINPPRPMSVVAEARVTDVNRQAWTSAATLLVHPADLYIGLRRQKYFFEKGQPIEVEAIVVDHDGEAAIGKPAQVKAVRLDWEYKNGEYVEVEADEQLCPISSAKDPILCSFDTEEGGTYRLTATVTDDLGRPNQSQILVWVTGGKMPPSRKIEQEEVSLIPDKKEYRAGDTARLLVQAPFFPAEGLITYRRSGITRTDRFRLTDATTTVDVPIRDGHTPNVHIQIDLVGSAARTDDAGNPDDKLPRRPAYAAGSINLSVPPDTRKLVLDVAPGHKKIEPGGSTSVEVRVRDRQGRPVSGAELAVVVVDESVLALSGYQTPDPLSAFYWARDAGAQDYHSRQYVQLARPEQGALGGGPPPVAGDGDYDEMDNGGYREEAAAEAPGAGGIGDMAPAPEAASRNGGGRRSRAVASKAKKVASGSTAAATPIAIRKNFNALAVFAPAVTTDAQGRARVPVKVPDNLTRYRIMVAAVSGERNFGAGESNVTARMPLMVRPSPPRFLNFGDKFELPVVLQNQTDSAMAVEVAVRASNAAITAGSGRRLTIPANDRVEVRFPAAAEMAGTARFQVAASSGKWSDANEFALPVWTPATSEAFATYGEIDDGAVKQPVAMPSGVVTEFGGLEVTTSSTQLQALTDAFLYLVQYPFECAEQTSSRIMAIAALRDVLTAFEASGLPSPKEIEAAVTRDIKRLQSLQNHDGGFAFWVRGYDSWPYISIHAAHALVRAKDKGYAVPDGLLSNSQRYLKNIERHIPSYYSIEVRRTLIAYALYVRKKMGDYDGARARQLIAEAGLDKLSMEAIGWLLGTLTGDRSASSELSRMRRHLDNKATETAAAANWTTSYSDGAHLILHSSRRADGIILESLITDQPQSDLIPKVVRGLLAHRTRGRWSNTQENAFVLLAMDAYFQKYEKVTPNFVARLWIGDRFAGEQPFKGRETKYNHLDVPMSYLAKTGGSQDLVLSKQGRGRLYYRIGMTYAPSNLRLPPADHGFAVERRYEAVDDPADVARLKDGSWQIRAGARVRVRLTMVAENRRYHVALVDPLPAGLEPLNPALAVTGSIPQDPNAQQQDRYWWWMRPWYEHQNMRDERVEAFTSLLWAGVHEYTYVAQATTPGTFVVPPTKAEEMYFPETFGRSAGDRVVVR